MRYLTAVAALRLIGPEFPLSTLAVTLVGAFAIGLVQHLGASRALSETARLFLATGVMGGLFLCVLGIATGRVLLSAR
ncbi:MAG: hypothetical protein HY216_04815 [Candidatus Rokubacteria bacterium]|nr:hypothetical protein [Candidatus Rokubacteria bacterium]